MAQTRALADGTQAERLPQLSLVANAQRGRETSVDPKANLAFGGFRASPASNSRSLLRAASVPIQGLADMNTVLDMRRNQLRAQDALLQARAARWAAAVAIRRAFAGTV